MSRHGDDDNGDLNDIALTEGSEPLSAPTDDCITLPSLRQAQLPRENDAPPGPSRRSPILPDDLIVEILLRLPVKFLMQFRCVSKSWKSLISDPQFVNKHLRMANASLSHHRLVMSTVSVFKPHSDFNVDRLLTCSAQSFLSDPSNSVDFSLEKKTKTKTKFRIQGSCNGLLCFVYYFEKTWRVSVWNPSNRWESKKSPRLVFRRKSRPDVLFGFGYDHLTDNYKVVAVSWYPLSKTAVKVYTLGTNSWRKTEGFPYAPQQPDGWGKFLCGTLNWLVFRSNVLDGWGCEPRDRLVMSFDLGKETFREVLLPDHDDQDYSFPNIGILRDFLCYYYLYRKYSFVLWKMKEYGVKESWNKLVTIPLQDVGIDGRIWHPRPLFMSENGEVLMDICGLFLYNPQDNSVKYLEFNEDKMFIDLRVYVESLVSPCS